MRGFLLSLVVMLGTTALSGAQTASTDEALVSRSQIEDFGQALGAAEAAAARPLSRLALEMIKEFEGWKSAAYNDPVGYCTIGYGHLIALKRCEEIDLGDFARPLTMAAGEALLQKDTASARLAVQRAVTVDLSDDQFGALVSFVFNVGKTNFHRSTLLKTLNFGDYEHAGVEMGRWIVSKGRVIDGLVQRRSCEVAMFRGHLKLNRSGHFDRRACASLGVATSAGPLVDVNIGE